MTRADDIGSLLARRDIDTSEVLLIAEVGSNATGTAVAGTDDDDYTVVRIEPFGELVNGPNSRQSMMIRTQPDGARSYAGDIDLNVYTLRKFTRLAQGGNPSILGTLFSPNRVFDRDQTLWADLARLTASKRAGAAFLGYMRQQLERWRGERGQKNVSRPELVEQYGFDTKYAGHVLRLGFQGVEYLLTGWITLPMPEWERGKVVACRTGMMTEGVALLTADLLEVAVKTALDDSPLPEQPDQGAIEEFLMSVYQFEYLLGRSPR